MTDSVADISSNRWTVEIGGIAKHELLRRLREQSIALNRYAEVLFASDLFTTLERRQVVQAVAIAVEKLGFPSGTVSAEIVHRMNELGLCYCPLELGPHLRLQYADQPEGAGPERPHQAPSGSLTVFSQPVSDDDDFPKGFYLRCMDGVMWLRGYISPEDHRWAPDDMLVFSEK